MSGSGRDGRSAAGSRQISVRTVIAAVIVVLALIFVFQNTGSGRVSFLFWEFNAPAWIWLVIVFAAGVAVGSVFPWFRRRKRSDH
ncbi:MAG: LapA family protein [Micrococcales bacterium]|nr:LapA family protein [Micrococcales bacterium]